MFEKIEASPTLADRLTSELLQKIESGFYPRGAKLPPEPELSRQFGVSRTVVREAVSRLKNDGIVIAQQGSGVFVSSTAWTWPLKILAGEVNSEQTVIQIIELRRAIESEIAALAAVRRSDAQLAAIETALAEIHRDSSHGGDGVHADVLFHRSIAEATGNPFLLKTLRFLDQFLEAATAVTRANEALREDFSLQVREEHVAIVAAIRAGDATQAQAAAQMHMINAARRLKSGAA
jgi:GntR family transcriptional repressor for pyruvate dehydrogenase complex